MSYENYIEKIKGVRIEVGGLWSLYKVLGHLRKIKMVSVCGRCVYVWCILGKKNEV